MILNKKLLALKTRSYTRKNDINRANLAYKQARSVGILFSTDDLMKHELVKRFIKTLEADGKRVKVLAFLPKGHDNYEFRFDFFTANELSFWGNIDSETVTKFTAEPFDYLFCLDRESNELIQHVLAMSKAKCRIGCYKEQNAAYCEMMVQPPNGSTQGLVDEMYKYAKLLT